MQQVILWRTTFLNCAQDVSCWLKRTCRFGKMLIGLFKEKKRQHRVKLSLTQFWSVFCAYVSSIPHIVVLETMYKMKRVVVSENCSCHSKWSLCGMFFVPFFCHFLMSGVTVNFLSSTVIWHFSEFHRNHTMKLIELFFHIRGWRYKGYIF